jgi:acyl carrier protein
MGSTEAGRICSAILDQTFSFPEEGTAAGFPRRGKKILLLDENGHEVGPNQVGEIAVKGAGLGVGYWKKPDLTSANFISDQSSGDETICLTGDLGRMLPDGFVVHLGRKDSMVKIRGYRVELAEIEKSLHAHPAVKDAGVVAWDRRPGEKFLVAYVVARQDPPPTVNELNDFLRKKLPDYMIPSAFMFTEALPLTNGKLDRRALPKPNERRPELSQPYVLPRNEVERTLTGIWAEILSLDRVGVHDNFFDLGGHSLAATRVVSQVIKNFQLELPIQSLFESPTVADMAAVINQHREARITEEELERLLAEVESMSEEEAKKLVVEHGKE